MNIVAVILVGLCTILHARTIAGCLSGPDHSLACAGVNCAADFDTDCDCDLDLRDIAVLYNLWQTL